MKFELRYGRSWEQCERGDWMLWFYAEEYPDNIQELTLTKGHCANTVRHLMTDKRSIMAVDAAIAYGEGKISKEALRLSAFSAAIADAIAYERFQEPCSAAYAAYAAYAAASTSVIHAGSPASFSASAMGYESASGDSEAARKKNQQATANICRKYLRLNDVSL